MCRPYSAGASRRPNSASQPSGVGAGGGGGQAWQDTSGSAELLPALDWKSSTMPNRWALWGQASAAGVLSTGLGSDHRVGCGVLHQGSGT